MKNLKVHSSILSLLFVFSPITENATAIADDVFNLANQKKEVNQILPYYQLPKNPKTPVVILDYRGGRMRRISDEPAMSILADGTVLLPKRHAHSQAFEGKLTKNEVQDLLHFIIGNNVFFTLENESIAEAIAVEKKKLHKAGKRVARIMDASTVKIEVNANDKINRVSHYPSGLDESKIPDLVKLKVIQKRLSNVSSFVQLGGKKEVEKWLKKSNAKLSEKYPDAEPLTMEDFSSGAKRNNGSISISFYRPEYDEQGETLKNQMTVINIEKPAGKPATITVTCLRNKTE